MPSRPYIISILKKLYETEQEKLLHLLKSKQIGFTTDIWTSSAIDPYMTVTAHFVNDDWGLESRVLETKEMAERHTGTYSSNKLCIAKFTILSLLTRC